MEWMKPPLPPLSESLIASGLVSSQTKIIRTNQAETQKRSRSVTTAFPISRKTATKQSALPIKQVWKKQETHVAPREIVPFACAPNTAPRPHITVAYRPPPIESLFSVNNETLNNNFLLLPSLESGKMTATTDFSKNLRDEIIQIASELDANISTITMMVADENVSDFEKQANLKTQLLQSYNYSFNKYILLEKSKCHEKAVFLRRLQKFFNQLIADLPEMSKSIKAQVSEWSEKFKNFSEHADQVELKMKNVEAEKKFAMDELEKVKKQLQFTIEESNNKDIQISSNAFDLDFTKGQTTQLQFKLQSKNDRLKTMKTAVLKLEDENRNQLSQIESLTSTINQFQQGQTGYIAMYHEKTAICEKLEMKNKELEENLLKIINLEKKDENVDTSDLVEKLGHNNKLGTSKKNKVKASAAEDKNINLNEDQPLMNKYSSVSIGNTKRKSNHSSHARFSGQNSTITIPLLRLDAETQTDAIQDLQNMQNHQHNLHNSQLIQPNNLNISQIDQQQNQQYNSENLHNPHFSQDGNEEALIIGETDRKLTDSRTYTYPLNYDVDHKELEKFPDLLETIIPFLSQPYSGDPIEQEIKLISSSANSMLSAVVKNEKPLVWGLQVIHNFLNDPFVRSIENQNRVSLESIFIDWISRQNKLQHIVSQILSDFSLILTKYQQKSELITLFSDVLSNKMTFSQLCFLSTLYTFSNAFTFPNIPKMLQSMNNEENVIEIHVEVVKKIITKCFTDELGNEILKALHIGADISNNFDNSAFEENLTKTSTTSLTPSSMMVNYFDFLKESTVFFGTKHCLVYSQSKHLLALCSCFDAHMVNFDVFTQFFAFLSVNNPNTLKDIWKIAISRHENTSNSNIVRLSDILTICAERKKPFMDLLGLQNMAQSVQKMKSLQSVVSDLYHELCNRYAKVIPHVFTKVSSEIVEKVNPIYLKLKTALLKVDLPQIIWCYRLIVMQIDKLIIKEKGFIPFNLKSTSDQITKLVEYIDRSESVAFAMLD